MAFDFKKEYKALYATTAKSSIVDVPATSSSWNAVKIYMRRCVIFKQGQFKLP
ncbi:MAG: hypothetical protein LBK66_13170 [Spirochaetaceae bacterium]|nr:hypothetical protein [Spirochaetaceae bacterium]